MMQMGKLRTKRCNYWPRVLKHRVKIPELETKSLKPLSGEVSATSNCFPRHMITLLKLKWLLWGQVAPELVVCG